MSSPSHGLINEADRRVLLEAHNRDFLHIGNDAVEITCGSFFQHLFRRYGVNIAVKDNNFDPPAMVSVSGPYPVFWRL